MNRDGQVYILTEEDNERLNNPPEPPTEKDIELREDLDRMQRVYKGFLEGSLVKPKVSKSRMHETLAHDSSGGKTYRKGQSES